MKQPCFLNYAATAPIKPLTASFMSQLCEELSEPLGARFYTSLSLIEQTRRRLADLIGAFPREIAFFNNTSTALSMLALALPFEKGDVVLTAADEFSSNRFVWQNLASKGVIFRTFQTDKNKSLTQSLEEIDLSHVKLISISAVSYCSGRLYELEAFCAFCKKRGIWSCLDAIQAVGATPIDCHHLDVDFLVGGAQKWLLGPVGCGYLYAKDSWRNQLFTPLVGWTSSKYPEKHDIERLEFCDELARFEPGLPNFLSIAALGHSLENLEKTGWPFIFEEIQKRTLYLQENLTSLGYTLLSSPQTKAAGIVSTEIPSNILPRLALEHFEKRHIIMTIRSFMRVSPHYDTPFEQLDYFLQAAADLKKTSFPTWSKTEKALKTDPKKTKTAWILGATGTLGQEISHQFAQRGYKLKLFAKNPMNLEDLEKKLSKKESSFCSSHSLDLSDYESVLSTLEKLKKEEAGADVLVIACAQNSAARFDQVSPEIHKQMSILSGIGLILGAFEKKASKKAQVVALSCMQTQFGVPYMSYNHALHMGLMELLKSFELESGLWTEIVIAKTCHSNLQKRIGRTLLRYFKMGGTFDYEHPEKLAFEIAESIENRKKISLPFYTKIKLCLNILFPSIKTRIFKRLQAP